LEQWTSDIAVFTRVVQAGSFTGASRALGMTESSASGKVDAPPVARRQCVPGNDW
jgi:hypothetical protein